MQPSDPSSEPGGAVEPIETAGAADPHGSPGAPRDRAAGGSVATDLLNLLRGFCMGAADTVPGVSGGTVALILGHYQRLVTAISHVDGDCLRLAAERRLGEAADHVDARFLGALGLGIGTGVVTLAGAMHWLLEHRLPATLAVFLGLVLASAWIVARHVDRWTLRRGLVLLAGAGVAVAISAMPTGGAAELSPLRLFLSAAVAICAMILPGISGAFVLLLLGAYRPVTGMVRQIADGQLSVEIVGHLAAFAAGCAVGLLVFSRLLRWLLDRCRGATMAALLGLMLGSLGRLWPLQMPTAETAQLAMKHRELVYIAPADWPGSVAGLLAWAAAAGVAVLVIERIARWVENRGEMAESSGPGA